MNDDETYNENIIKNGMVPNDVTVTDLDLQQIQTVTSLDKAFSELFTNKNIEQKTEFLKKSEIATLGSLYTNARFYGLIVLQQRIVTEMAMRVSLKRKGREEGVALVKAEREHEEMRNMLEQYTREGNK